MKLLFATLILSLLVVLSIGTIIDVTGDNNEFNFYSEGIEPYFYFATLYDKKIVQNTSFILMQTTELLLPSDDSPPSNSTFIIASSIPTDELTWTSGVTNSGNNKVITFTTTDNWREVPSWNSLTLQITWDQKSTQFNLDLIVENYTFYSSSNLATLGFFIGVSDVSNNSFGIELVNTTTFTVGSSYGNPSLLAPVNGTSSTVPVYFWLNIDTLIVQVGKFSGDVSETIVMGTTYTDTVSGGGSSFWTWFFVSIIIILAIIGVIGAIVAAAVGFVFYQKKRQASLYDNL